MRAEDLMIGDIVTFKDCQYDENPVVIKIWQIKQDGEAFAFIDDDGSVDEIVIDDEIVGIPIIPEILEKNGFIRDGESWWYQDFRIVLSTSEGVSLVCGRQKNFVFVHELQHALRLCGIEKTIEL